ncbi:hypothetical protein ACA910_012148 [Epithemia clementina (nom. ined.)]
MDQADAKQTESVILEGRRKCSAKLKEASEIIDRLFSCGIKVLPVVPSSLSSSSSLPQSPTMSKKSSYLSRIQTLLDSRTPEEGTEYLKTTIVDLLHETEVLKLKLEQSQQEITTLKQEVHACKQKDGERIDALVKTLQMATCRGKENEGANYNYSNYNSNRQKEAQQQDEDQPHTLSREQAEALNGEQASLMTITALTRKIEQLSVKNSQLVHERQQITEKMEDLEAEGEAKDMKIKALETQFKSINRTRQKVVHKLGLSGTTDSFHRDDDTSSSEDASPRKKVSPLSLSSATPSFLRLASPRLSP